MRCAIIGRRRKEIHSNKSEPLHGVFEGLQRIEKDIYPVAAIREMLLNALVHRTCMGSMIQIRVYDHKLTLWNEGNLPEGMTIKSLKGHHVSRPRNPLIADVCFKAGYIDSWGRGTIKIYEACKAAGLPEPEITGLDGGILVTLHTHLVVDEGCQIITERQREVLDLILQNNKISRKEIAVHLGIAESAVQKHIKALTKLKVIRRVGTKNGYWVIKK